MKVRLALFVAVATLCQSLVARATPWTEDRRYGEGIGIRTGNLELHPGVAGEFGYDSNYFQRADSENPLDTLRLRLTPSLTLSTLGAQRREAEGGGAPPTVDFDAGLFFSYNEFFPLGDEQADEIRAQRDFDAGANFAAKFLPQKPVGFDVYGDYLRTFEPSNSPDEDLAFDRNSVRGGAGVTWRPGGGLFEWRFGYEAMYNFFEAAVFEDLNNLRHTIKTSGRWRFLPRTALLYDADYRIIRFTDPGTEQNDGEMISSRLGLRGLVTNRFALMAMAGWSGSFFDANGGNPARNFDTIIAHAEVTWYLLPQPRLQPTTAQVGLSTVSLGYIRDFRTSYLGAFYERDRGYLNFSYFIGGQVVLALEGGLSHINYPDSSLTGEFSENRVDSRLFAEYRLSNTIGLNTTIQYDANLTSTVIGGDDLSFSRFRAFLGLRWFM